MSLLLHIPLLHQHLYTTIYYNFSPWAATSKHCINCLDKGRIGKKTFVNEWIFSIGSFSPSDELTKDRGDAAHGMGEHCIDISAVVSCTEGLQDEKTDCPDGAQRSPMAPAVPWLWPDGYKVRQLKTTFTVSEASQEPLCYHIMRAFSPAGSLGVKIIPQGIMQPLKPARIVFSPFKIPSRSFFWLIAPDNLNLVPGFGGIESLG